MHPDKLRGQCRKKLRCVKVGLLFLKTAKQTFNDKSRKSKRHKSSGSSSFNAESGEASINLNTNVGDNDEDDVPRNNPNDHKAGTKRKLLGKRKGDFCMKCAVKRLKDDGKVGERKADEALIGCHMSIQTYDRRAVLYTTCSRFWVRSSSWRFSVTPPNFTAAED
ncbi:hypothetical protein Tco_1515906 [Tanacetum coccineum]